MASASLQFFFGVGKNSVDSQNTLETHGVFKKGWQKQILHLTKSFLCGRVVVVALRLRLVLLKTETSGREGASGSVRGKQTDEGHTTG